jgi:hypothetical protein
VLRDSVQPDSRRRDAWTRRGRAEPHLLEGYLRDPAGVDAIIGAWCRSVKRIPRDLQKDCSALR